MRILLQGGLFVLALNFAFAGGDAPTASESIAPQDLAEIDWQKAEPALPFFQKDASAPFYNGNNKVLKAVEETLDDGSHQPWQKTSSADQSGWQTQLKPDTGLRWEHQIQTDVVGVVHFMNRVSLPSSARSPVSIVNYTFAARNGDMTWDGFSLANNSLSYSPKVFHGNPFGENTPYAVLSSATGPYRLHFYLPDWIDLTGAVSVFGPPPKNDPNQEAVLCRLQLKSLDGRGPAFMLQPGTSRQWEVRMGLFPSKTVPGSLGEKDFLANPTRGFPAFSRGEFLAMGFPLPMTPTEKPGHFFTVWPSKDTPALIPLLAKAGTQFIVVQSPDFGDISQGVSWQGDYDQAPPVLPQLIETAHRYGIKVLWWFSIEGVLRANTKRNNGIGSPLLLQHPDWFVPQYYWSNQYQHTSRTSAGWKDWVLKKIEHDQARYPLDGFAFDEPYFASYGSENGRTYARYGYDFLKALSEKVHACPRPQWMIGNYAFPQDDEWKFFDYMMLERASDMRFQAMTLGRHPAGHAHANLFSFKLILNQLAYNFCDYDEAIGWSAPEWYFKLYDAKKTPDQIAQLLSYSGKWHRVWAAEIRPGLRQIEIARNGEHRILLCNVGDAAINDLEIRPHAFQLSNPAGTGPMAWATTDTNLTHDESAISSVVGHANSLPIKSLPPVSITAIRFTAK